MITVILTKPEKMNKLFVERIKKSKGDVVGVLSSKPYFSVESELKNSCKSKQCLFIDTVSESKGENVIYIDPSNLTGLSIAINQALQGLGKKTNIIFDSVSNLSIRNNQEVLSKFLMFIMSKSRDWKAEVILVLPEDDSNSKIVSVAKQAADKIEVKN